MWLSWEMIQIHDMHDGFSMSTLNYCRVCDKELMLELIS